MRPLVVLVAVCATVLQAVGQERPGYVVLAAFPASDPFEAVVTRLAEHRGAAVVRFDPADLDPVRSALAAARPHDVALVMRPEQIEFGFARRFLQLATELDDDPFVDFAFGYVTGRDPKAALALVEAGIARAARTGPPRIGVLAGGGAESLVVPQPCVLRTERLGGLRLVVAGEEAFPEIGRDRAFLREHLPELGACAAVTFVGHGWPREVVGGPTYADLQGLRLDGCVALNVACYTGVTHVWYEDDHRRGVLARREIPLAESFCLALLDTGVVGYTAYLCPRPAGPELETDLAALVADGLSLGEARRRDYDKTVLGFLGFGAERLALADVTDGAALPRGGDVVRDLMLEGATGGVLFGDPAVVPFAPREGQSPVSIEVAPIDGGVRLLARTSLQGLYLHCSDPTARFGGTMAMKVHARVPIGDAGIEDVVVEELRIGRERVATRVLWAVEEDQGERYLQLKVNFPRGERMLGGMTAKVRILTGDDRSRRRGGTVTPPESRVEDVGAREAVPALRERARAHGVRDVALQAALDASASELGKGDVPPGALDRLAAFHDEGFGAVLAMLEVGQSHYRTFRLVEATWRPGLERELIALASMDPLPNFATWQVLESLGVADTPEVRTFLRERLRSERDPGLYMSTARALARLGVREVADEIGRSVLESRPGWQGVERYLVASLATLGGEHAIGQLERIASDRTVRASDAALAALEPVDAAAAARARAARDSRRAPTASAVPAVMAGLAAPRLG